MPPREPTLIGLRFGANLRRSRRFIDQSQEALALLIEVNRTEIAQLEGGLRLPRLDTILKLAAGVEASPPVLLAGMEWHPGYYVEGKFSVEDETVLRVLSDRS